MASEKKRKLPARRFSGLAAHASTGIEYEHQAMGTRVGRQRKNFDRLSVDFGLQIDRRDIRDGEILGVANGNWQNAVLASRFLREHGVRNNEEYRQQTQ